MKKGLINKDVIFPVIVIMDGEYSVDKNISGYTICKKSAIPDLAKRNEFVIDAATNYYKRIDISFLRYINSFWGFSLKYAGVGVCYTERKLELVKNLNIDELKGVYLTYLKEHSEQLENVGLDTAKMIREMTDLTQKEEVFRRFVNTII
ncbi:MAG: hypothetical protein QM781_04865 [Chitinophagaceae bacterium]